MTPYRDAPIERAADANASPASIGLLRTAALALSFGVPIAVVGLVVLLLLFGEEALWGIIPVLLLVSIGMGVSMRESDRVWDAEEDRVARMLHETDD